MAKISPVSPKYIIHSSIDIEGVVDRPDVIGAIFGQTEGLLGADLELRELQRSGRIGRIEVDVDTRGGKTHGTILIPSSLDKAETSIVAASLEIIQRIGPCNAKIHVQKIEDVRVSKRSFVIERAKELLRTMNETVLPDSQELADEVAYSVRVMEIREYGKDRLPAGPSIDDSDEIILVEGRADVVNLLKHGFKNVIAMNGTSIPQTIIELSKKKVMTAFVDGDRGGNLIIKELTEVADIDYVTKAPDGKEVEEITKKEIHKALRSRISAEQAKLEINRSQERMESTPRNQQYRMSRPPVSVQQPQQQNSTPVQRMQNNLKPQPKKVSKASPDQLKVFRGMLEGLIGTRGAQLLDKNLGVLGKVPLSELKSTIQSLGGNVFAIVFDGTVDRDIGTVAERADVDFLVAMDSKVRQQDTKVTIITANNL